MDEIIYSHNIHITPRPHHWSRLIPLFCIISFFFFFSWGSLNFSFTAVYHLHLSTFSAVSFFLPLIHVIMPSLDSPLYLMSLKPVIGKFDVQSYDEHSELLISSLIPSNLTAGMHMPTCSSSGMRDYTYKMDMCLLILIC